MDRGKILFYLSTFYKGNWDLIRKEIEKKEPLNVEESEIDEMIGKCKSKFITIFDEEYPEALRHAYKPPFLLFYRGNISLIKDFNKCVSCVGSREASKYGKNVCESICSNLAEDGYTIVSGLAKGIDLVAATSSLDYGKCVAVLGNGLNHKYPKANAELQERIEEEGLLLSEYPDDILPTRSSFPERNRIIAGISKLTILGESYSHSGTLITAMFALNMGRDVACIPYPADTHSTNNILIKEGAYLVENAADVEDILDGTKI